MTITGTRPSGPTAVYLDHHATTPVDPRVARVVFETMTNNFGNAHSVDHIFGQSAAGLVGRAAVQVADFLSASPKNVRFTSGATEAIRIALEIAVSKRKCLKVGVSRVEHKAVLHPLLSLERQGRATLVWIDADSAGRIALEDIKSVVEQDIDLLCLMAANNEIGTIYPIREAAALAAKSGVEILVDATPAAGRTPIEIDAWNIDYLVLSAHKLYGPKGAGALVSAAASADDTIAHSGTLNVPAIIGFAEACRIHASEGPAAESKTEELRNRLETALLNMVDDLTINGDRQNRLTNNLHISAPGAPNDAVISRLERKVAISTGAACASGAQEPSHVLRAMKLSPELQETALRISPGRFNTLEEIDYAADQIASAIADVRAAMRTRE